MDLLTTDHKVIILETWKGLKKMNLTDIVCFSTDFQGVKIVLKDDSACFCSESLAKIASILNHSGFFRIHRKCIVNLLYFNELDKKHRILLIKYNDHLASLPVSRRNLKHLIFVLKKYFNQYPVN